MLCSGKPSEKISNFFEKMLESNIKHKTERTPFCGTFGNARCGRELFNVEEPKSFS